MELTTGVSAETLRMSASFSSALTTFSGTLAANDSTTVKSCDGSTPKRFSRASTVALVSGQTVTITETGVSASALASCRFKC
jgi:Tfp pilus assembly protein PilW